jgi:thioredoxin reductase (NADPH)
VDYYHFDAGQIGHTISWWPRNTHFFSTSERLAIAGIPIQSDHQQRLTGEEYLVYLRAVVEQLDLQVRTYERVVRIERLDQGFVLCTETQTGPRRYRCRRVVLAKGNMDRPNVLGIPGEDLAHVTHHFTDPHVYFRKRLLVVGGRNSAVEAALRCWRAGAQVALSYRRAEFLEKWVKPSILPDLKTQIRAGNIAFYPETVPVEILPSQVVLAPVVAGQPGKGGHVQCPADFVLLCTGFSADLDLFASAGVALSGQERVPQTNPQTMETNVPGLYVAGTAAAGDQRRYTLFIENCHQHVAKIVAAVTGQWPDRIGTIAARKYDVPLEAIQAN